MKKIILVTIALLVSISFEAQNKNIKDETKTTTTTITDSNGKKTYVKKENTREVQKIELKEEKPNTLNIETKDSPVVVTTTTKITNPDGSTRTVDVDRSSYYMYDNKKYNVELDANGYRITGDDIKKSALLRKTSTNSFIYYNGKETSIGYFDTDGNLVLETYNSKTDTVTYKTYVIVKQ
ncbi:hypothetical protein [Flavobacterium sp.]|jgi:hypothetical protein|uniref:hypothetical protein n=1 Tax=Flavobacterium sp. TaxID=239 RepID=UPI0037C057FA